VSGTLTKLLATSGAVVGTYPVGQNPFGVVFDGTNLWVANQVSSGTVTKLLASTGTVIGSYSVGQYPYWVGFDGANLWVTNGGSNAVTKIPGK